MDNIKDDNYYATKIRDDFQFIIESTTNLSNKEIVENEILLDSIMFRLIQISENSQRLSENFKSKSSDIPWLSIRGLRNRIVHDYGNVDYSIIFQTLQNDIPLCAEKLNEIIR